MSEILAFIFAGALTGMMSAFMVFRFDSSSIKALSSFGSLTVIVGEFMALSELFNIEVNSKAEMFAYLIASFIFMFLLFIVVLLKSFKKQSTKYKLHGWEILLGDKKAIDDYYESKKLEIENELTESSNIEELRRLKSEIDKKSAELDIKRELAQETIDFEKQIIKRKQVVKIPDDYNYKIKEDFFELLPRYIKLVAAFEYHINSFTDDYIRKIQTMESPPSENIILKTYLLAIGSYVGQFLFEWRDVRVHFRYLNVEKNVYEKYVAASENSIENMEPLTPIPADRGLIALATQTKRSVVYSANRAHAFDTGSGHIWTDYITMVFDKLHIDGKPILSLGVSVEHKADHKEMLYFLSYIQIEKVIQKNLVKLDQNCSVENAAFMEVA